MRQTQFSITVDVVVNVFGRDWHLTATVTPKGWECEPVLMWLDHKDPAAPYWVPGEVWDAVQAQLDDGGPARVQFDNLLGLADLPFTASAGGVFA